MSKTLTVDGQEQVQVMTMAVVRAAEKLSLSGKGLATILVALQCISHRHALRRRVPGSMHSSHRKTP